MFDDRNKVMLSLFVFFFLKYNRFNKKYLSDFPALTIAFMSIFYKYFSNENLDYRI